MKSNNYAEKIRRIFIKLKAIEKSNDKILLVAMKQEQKMSQQQPEELILRQ